ncbi:hypothetical protein niasHT_022229 [Heterodera trifolii]|uniref:Uncharacterized protein n=1 Tax=Heterodera trifolii TaxID=157864 RepID=A0ABD2KP23_9BILA
MRARQKGHAPRARICCGPDAQPKRVLPVAGGKAFSNKLLRFKNYAIRRRSSATICFKKNDFALQPPIKRQEAPASVARPCHNKSLRVERALSDARALKCVGMSRRRMEVSVSFGAFKRMMRKAEKNLRIKGRSRTQNNLPNESIKVATKSM